MSVFFHYPGFLLLWLVAPLAVWVWWRQRGQALRFSDTRGLGRLPRGRGASARVGGALLRGTALMLLIAALAGPRWPDQGTRLTTQGVALALVVDVSGSMAEPDFVWEQEHITRMEAVKRVCRLFVNGGVAGEDTSLPGRKGDLIGLVTFATHPESVCPLTVSHSTVLDMLEREQPRRVPTESQTNIGDAVAWALFKLQAAGESKKAMLLFTDGEHNVPPPALKPSEAAQIAASLGVPIYTIDVGGAPSSLERPVPKPAPGQRLGLSTDQSLQSVSAMTGGRYFRADNWDMLLTACQDIDRLQQSDIQTFQYRRYYEGYAWFASLALGLLFTVYCLDRTIWLRVPQ